MKYDREHLKTSIKLRLGSEYVPVELGDDAIEVLIDNSLLLFTRYKPLIRHETAKYDHNGINTLVLPEDVIGVQNVEMISAMSSALSSGLAIENAILSGAPIYYGVGDTIMDISYLDYRRRWLKTVARELGTDPDYGITKDPETGRWTVHTFSTGGVLVDATCAIEHNPNLNTIAYEWQAWFTDYCIAESKCTIGESRSKFDKIPVAGTMMGMNGAALKAEGTNEKARLIADLQASRVDLYPRWA
jgi:hypothetical protein